MIEELHTKFIKSKIKKNKNRPLYVLLIIMLIVA